MNRKLLSPIVALLLSVFLLPTVGYAEPLTPLEECIAGFYAAADYWDANVPNKTGYGVCDNQKGGMYVGLNGTDPLVKPPNFYNFNSRLFKDGGFKACSSAVARHEGAGGNTEVTFIELRGADAAKFNKFLKLEGCPYALNLLP